MSAQPGSFPVRLVPNAGGVASADEQVKRELARELHDEVVQELTAMLIDLENFKSSAFDRQTTVKQLDSVQGSLRAMLGSMRNLLYGLRSEDAVERDFAEQLRVFAVQYTARHGVRVQIRAGREWPDPIRRSVAQHLSRVVQEAVNNARQHGGASHVRVSMRVSEHGLARVAIQDDGCGMRGDETLARPGLGLLGMRERALLLGGSLSVDSAAGRGTTVRLVFPGTALAP